MMKLVVFLFFGLSVASETKVNFRKFANGNKIFTVDVYQEVLTQNSGNFLVCPFSAQTILAVAQSGAKGETAEEIRKVLHFPNTTQDVEKIFKKLLPSMKGKKRYSLHTANRIYINGSYPIKNEFKKTARDVYQSSIENINFSQKVQAAKKINDWVYKQTKNKIQNLVSEDSLSEDTVAILINALYFKGAWKKGFKQQLTKKRVFHKTTDETMEVDMMQKKDSYDYYESSELNAKFLKMFFRGGGHVQMIIVLPNEIEGLATLEKQMEKVLSVSKFSSTFVNVVLPKFKMETSIDFKKILTNLGMKKAFTFGDFSGITREKGEIHISDVVQKTFIEVNEVGIEAAAASAVHMHAKSLMISPLGETDFVVDHPFLFYIKINNILIFTGRVVSPF